MKKNVSADCKKNVSVPCLQGLLQKLSEFETDLTTLPSHDLQKVLCRTNDSNTVQHSDELNAQLFVEQCGGFSCMQSNVVQYIKKKKLKKTFLLSYILKSTDPKARTHEVQPWPIFLWRIKQNVNIKSAL